MCVCVCVCVGGWVRGSVRRYMWVCTCVGVQMCQE